MSDVSGIKVNISKNSINELNSNNTSFNISKNNAPLNNINTSAIEEIGLNENDSVDTNSLSHKVGNILETGWDNLKLSTGAVVGYGFKIFGGMSDEDFHSVMSDIEEENKTNNSVYSAITGVIEPGETVIKSGNQNFEDLVNGRITVDEYISKTGSTMTTFNISILEGIGEWGEKASDAGILLFGKMINYDLKSFHIINEEQYNKNMESVKDYVEEEGIKGLFDEFYDTNVGSIYKDESDNFETVRQFGNMTGETAMNIGMAYVGGAAATSSNAATITSAVSAGVTGFGEGAEDAYKKGADVNQGIKAGAMRGSVNAAQYYLGMKINNYNPYSSEVRNALGHVVLDTADGASEGFITPFIDMTYRSGYNNENGEYIQFDKSTTLADKYAHLFEENGGWANVGTQAFMGGTMSGVSEISGIAKHFRKEKVNEINNISVKNNVNNQEISVDSFHNPNFETIDKKVFLSKSADEQVKIIESSPTTKIFNLVFDESIDKSVKNLIDDKIVSNQNQIVLDQRMKYTYKKYMINNEKILSQLSDKNLALLSGELALNPGEIDMVPFLNEINKRVNNGSKIFRNPLGDKIALTNNGKTRYNLNATILTEIQKSDIDLFNKIMNRDGIYNYVESNPNLSKLNYGTYGFFQKAQLADMIEQSKIGQQGLDIIKELVDKNPNSLAYFDLELLDDSVINKFSTKFIKEVGMDKTMSIKLLSLKEEYPELYNLYAKIVKNNELDNSLSTYYIKNKDCLDFIFDGAEQLELDFNNVDIDELTNYMIGYSQNKKYYTNYSDNYIAKVSEKADNAFIENYKKYNIDNNEHLKSEYLKNMKESYFQKYFSSSYNEIKDIISTYGDNLGGISKYLNDSDGDLVKTFYENINKVMKITNVEELYDLYDNQMFRFTREDIIAINEITRKKYVDSYINALSKTKNKINTSSYETIRYNGKDVKIVDQNGDFGLFVYSSDTGLMENKKLVEDSYIKSWNNMKDPRTHGLSMSYISNDNIGTANVGGIGVLYGFYDLKNENIFEMAPYDMRSNINDYGYTSVQKQIFMSADSMSKNTTRVYNDFVTDRNSAKPSCIILYTDASDQLKNNAYKAASEWNIPILRIDKENLAKQQMKSINNNINAFNGTKDINYLKAAIDTYESSINGFKQNYNSKSTMDNSSLSYLFDSSSVDKSINNYIDNLSNMENNSTKIDELMKVFNETKNRYEVSNKNGTNNIANTNSVLDIDGYIAKLNNIRR